MAFFLFNLFSLRRSGRYRDWRHKLSAACQLTHSRTPLGTEVKDEVNHRFAGVALSTTLCKLGVQHPFVDQQEKDVCVSGQL